MIGTTFKEELVAAGVPLDGIAWGADGKFNFADEVPPEVRAQVAAVFAAHDADAQPAPSAEPMLARQRDEKQAQLDAAIAAAPAGTQDALRIIADLLRS